MTGSTPPFFSSSGSDGYVIDLEHIWYAYDRKSYVLKDVTLRVKKGASLMLMGQSGSGKSTLLKIVNGLLRPSRGRVNVLGVEMAGPGGSDEVRRHVGYIPQQLGLVRSRTALDNILLGSLPRMGALGSLLGAFPKEELELAERCLDLVGLSHKASEMVYRLSGGERQRVAIARALMQKPLILLADEFVSDLDHDTAHDILDLVDGLRREGITLLVATHDIDLAMEYGQTIITLRNGSVVDEVAIEEKRNRLLKENAAR